ncbi:MAG TPA: hypothetical protein VHS05_30715 [Pyrinomonadaceae bacterium]|jgi:hypothetical protein|nr:hypothetical protein [Pyrinomonadaceae bacterium]
MKTINAPSTSRLLQTACLLAFAAAMILVIGPWQQPVHSGTDNLPAVQASPTPYPCLSTPPASCPNAPVTTITSTQVPCDVCLPTSLPSTANGIAFFDDYSWRSFIALIWPALQGQRGVPDTTKTIAAAGPRVFETYKGLWELFHVDGSAPAAWNAYDAPAMNACGVQTAFGDLVLASFSKFSDLGQAGFGNLIGPLVAQNKTYVSFLTAYNQTEFDQITSTKWYLRANLPTTLTFQNQSMDIKSAWMDMKDAKNPQRYYTRTAWVMDPATGKCSQKTVGLVGLHIVQKTGTRPQWIWSTFEQVDNVPPTPAGGPGTFAFNNGDGPPMPAKNPYSVNPLPIPVPSPYNVTRTMPISTLVPVPGLPSTVQTNANYQQALKNAGSVFQFYQLVMTQWPTPGSTPGNSGAPKFTFPGLGAATSFANTTMETFDQASIGTGCMACHTVTQNATDFVWSLADHAFPPKIPSLLTQDPAFRELKTLIQSGTSKPAAKSNKKKHH